MKSASHPKRQIKLEESDMVTMLEQRFDPELDREPVLKRLVETASLYLEDETRETASPAVATWQRNSGRGTDPISLLIRDSTLVL